MVPRRRLRARAVLLLFVRKVLLGPPVFCVLVEQIVWVEPRCSRTASAPRVHAGRVYVRSLSSGAVTTRRFPSAFALGRAGVSVVVGSSSSSSGDSLSLTRSRPTAPTSSHSRSLSRSYVWWLVECVNELRSGDGVRERPIGCCNCRGPCGAGGGGARAGAARCAWNACGLSRCCGCGDGTGGSGPCACGCAAVTSTLGAGLGDGEEVGEGVWEDVAPPLPK